MARGTHSSITLPGPRPVNVTGRLGVWRPPGGARPREFPRRPPGIANAGVGLLNPLWVHWITWSARMRTDRGMVRPRAFAVFRLTTSSNRVGCSTGRSAGLAPFRILST